MDNRQYYDRKQYVEQVKKSFFDGTGQRKSYRAPENEMEEEAPRSFFRLRFAIALLLFFGFLFVRQANISYHSFNADNITNQIRRTVSLPESLPKLSEIIKIE